MKLSNSRFFSENKFLLIISLISFLLTYISTFVKGYGYFIDEFYYIACAARPAAGYVDHPPLAPIILSVYQLFFGTSLYAIRILPAIAFALTVFLTGITARELGGQKFSEGLAACAMAASPMAVAFAGFYSMNAFEPLIAIILLLIIIKMIKENNLKLWISAGIMIGLGMMNKHTFGVFVAALVISLLAAGKWRLVINRWFVFGVLCAFAVFFPNIIWQIDNHYPSLEFYRNISLSKNVYTPPLAFIMGQIISVSPSVFPVWLAGVIFLLLSKRMRNFSFISILFILLFLFMMISGTSRSDRMLFAYPAVIASGALFFEYIILKYNLRWFKTVMIVFVFTGLAFALPLILPYFSYQYVSAYVKTTGFNTELERGKKPPLPQILADRIGWEEKFNIVKDAYNSLPQSDKRRVIIAGDNYGQAGALELYGKKYNFPIVASGHNTYYLWSKGNLKGDILIQLDDEDSYRGLKKSFDSVEIFPQEFTNPYVSSHENRLRVFICRGPRIPVDEMLERGRFYY